jgi:hypothetical protein
MWWILGITAAIVGFVLVRWVVRERATIRRYRDRIEGASEVAEARVE